MAWIEEVFKRGKKIKHFVDDINPTHHTAILTLHDQHYQDDSLTWQNVNENLEDDTLSGFNHKCDRLRHAIHVSSEGGRRWIPRREYPDEYVEFGRLQYNNGTSWVNLNLGTPTRTGNMLFWDTTNFTLSIIITWKRIKILAVIKNSTAARPLRWQVSLNGLSWNNWSLSSIAHSVVVGYIDKPTAWDSNGTQNNPNIVITQTYSGGYVQFGGDFSSAVYPVTIDPTFSTPQDGTTADVGIEYADINTDTWGLNVRTPSRCAIVKFDISSIASDSTCTSATTHFTIQNNGSDATVTVYSILVANDGWTETGATFNHKVGSTNWAGGHSGCMTSGTDYNATELGHWHAYSADGTEHEYTTTLTASVIATWFGAVNSNYGIMLLGNEQYSEHIYYDSECATSGYRPYITIVYEAGGLVKDYTRGDYVSVPTNDANLETTYTASNIVDVETHNEVFVSQTGQLQHMIHEYKNEVGAEANCRITAILQTDLDTALSHLYLDIYNYHNSEWNNLAEENDVGANTDITFNVIVSDLSNYKNGSNMMCCRIRQEAI